jgi:3'(2'), 5'-bisphosphate nucleotidase
MVAEGAADRYPRFAPTMEWDTGAGHAICKAAGFRVDRYPELTELNYNKENLLNPWFLVH